MRSWRSRLTIFRVSVLIATVALATILSVRAHPLPSTAPTSHELIYPDDLPTDDTITAPIGSRGYVSAPFRIHTQTGVTTESASLASLSRWDWRDSGVVSPVRDQGDSVGGYAFAALASLESQMLLRNAGLHDLSENNLIECGQLYAAPGQADIWSATNYLTLAGTVSEDCDPWDPEDGPCITHCPYLTTLTDMWLLSGDTPPPTNLLKSWLVTYGPLHATYDAGRPGSAWALELDDYDGSYVLYNPTADTPNHAALLVGWDDSLTHDGGSGAWILKNSWGTDWGGPWGEGYTGGHMALAFDSAVVGTHAAVLWDWQTAHVSSATLHVDEAGPQSWPGFTGIAQPWGLVQLYPSHEGCATHVGLWTNDETVDVDVRIYDRFQGLLLRDLLWEGQNYAFSYAGYHSIPIEPPLPVQTANDLVVVVKFGYRAGQVGQLPADTAGPVSHSRSWFSSSGADGSWEDSTSLPIAWDLGIRLRVQPCDALITATPSPMATTETPTATATRTPPVDTPTPATTATGGATITPPTPTSTAPATLPPPTIPPSPTPVHSPTRVSVATPTPVPTLPQHRALLPVVLKRWPAVPHAPVLNPIMATGGSGGYTVSWSPSELADQYALVEGLDPLFERYITRYVGSDTHYVIFGQPSGTWYYRVRAQNSHGVSQWSNVESISIGTD